MYREMRRKDRQMTREEAEDLLKQADFGFLGLATTDGRPYVVPVNHAYVDGFIVFHCALQGHKLDLIRANPEASFAVCTQHEVLPHEYATRYRSAVAFGKAEIVSDRDLKKTLLTALTERLAPGAPFPCNDQEIDGTCVVRIRVEHVTGKKRD